MHGSRTFDLPRTKVRAAAPPATRRFGWDPAAGRGNHNILRTAPPMLWSRDGDPHRRTSC
ncbi:hypothetical protein MTBUT4_340037 [Magnetospirillum sp. UT-4]|nr:hypothetical protein MTBUT4_340037 [Magnetospirillum sp. UT-4]